MSLPNESPPVITVARLQNELDSLMAQYEAFDQRRSQKSVEAAFGVLVLLIGGGALSSLAIMRGRAGMLLAVLTGVVLFGRSLYRYRKERRTTLATMDRSLSLLGPQLRLADRLNMRWEYRNKLHDRLFTGPIEVTAAIIPVLEVTGDKDRWTSSGAWRAGGLTDTSSRPAYLRTSDILPRPLRCRFRRSWIGRQQRRLCCALPGAPRRTNSYGPPVFRAW
jgi:hypothetical protein